MNKPKKILAPTDFSPDAERALREAIAIAKPAGSEIVLLHVMERTDIPLGSVIEHHAFPNVRDEVRKGCMARLEELRAVVGEASVRSEAVLREGVPSVEIAKAAEELDVDLIVIASHGHGGLKHFLLGSTAERVLRIAPCQVLVVKDKKPPDGRG